MKIDPHHQVGGATSTKRKKGASFGDFGSLVADSSVEEESAAPVNKSSSLYSILMMQEVVSNEAAIRQAGLNHGKAMLSLLKDYQIQLASGHMSGDDIVRLKYGIATLKSQVRDHAKAFMHMPKLNELLEEIELRVAVEIAKLGRK